jgi:DNA-binding MarR family transcriptional regulator
MVHLALQMNTHKTTPKTKVAAKADATPNTVNLERYVPAYLTWIANKLSRGASKHYLNSFDVGIEIWRCLVLLALDGSVSAQKMSQVIGLDKGSVSRSFKSMQEKGLIRTQLDASDGRIRIAVLTPKGRALHDQIMGVALERERALLSALDAKEVDVLIGLLRRLHENLAVVEAATQDYVRKNLPHPAAKQSKAKQGQAKPSHERLNSQSAYR